VPEVFARAGITVLAVDIPSGVDGATGATAGGAVHAAETVCFQALKPGLLFEPGRTLAGRVHVVDIGIDIGDASIRVPEVSDLSLPQRSPTMHKWSAALLVVGGSTGMIGAPLMVAHAGARCGAGMVVCGVPGQEAAARVSGSEIVARALPAAADGSLDEDAGRVALKEIGRYTALAIGPGLGRELGAQNAARRLMAEAAIPIVVDADGLNALAADPAPLRVRRAAHLPRAVLTPHAGEYERLAGRPVGTDRIEAARALARDTDTVVLLKGPGTVIAAPDGTAIVNATDSAALASAGTGDVLTGIIGGLLANGVEPFTAAYSGAYVHGRAALAAGTAPDLVATDLITALPPTLGALRSGTDPWED
jgi:NAD(P)H-hydrate epimerase